MPGVRPDSCLRLGRRTRRQRQWGGVGRAVHTPGQACKEKSGGGGGRATESGLGISCAIHTATGTSCDLASVPHVLPGDPYVMTLTLGPPERGSVTDFVPDSKGLGGSRLPSLLGSFSKDLRVSGPRLDWYTG